jgi:hypothetical protein
MENNASIESNTWDRHSLVIVCVRGNVSVRETMRSILKNTLDPAGLAPVFLLGPTAPQDISNRETNKTAWITFMDGSTLAHPSGVEIIPPDNLLEVNLFIEKSVRDSPDQVLLGDFLDNVIKTTSTSESFYSFFCQLASRVKMRRRTAILVIKEDIHDKAIVEIVKRFADVVLEVRDQDDDEGSLRVEMRTLNFADNIYTCWRPFSEALRPIAVNC